MNNNWRQVRIFTDDFTNNWYFGLLSTFAVPFAAHYPETPLWFTRYTGDRKLGVDDDIADTDPNELKAPYLNAAQEHRSIRLRFCPSTNEESFLEALFTNQFWRSSFLPFNAIQTFSTGRFGSAVDMPARIKRTIAVANLLHANCRFILDVFQQHNGAWRFEPNGDGNNRFSGNPFQTMIHLMSQVTGTGPHAPLPLFWHEPQTNKPFLAACF